MRHAAQRARASQKLLCCMRCAFACSTICVLSLRLCAVCGRQAEQLTAVDATLGLILDRLEEEGLSERVHLIVTGDHGMAEISPNRTYVRMHSPAAACSRSLGLSTLPVTVAQPNVCTHVLHTPSHTRTRAPTQGVSG